MQWRVKGIILEIWSNHFSKLGYDLKRGHEKYYWVLHLVGYYIITYKLQQSDYIILIRLIKGT